MKQDLLLGGAFIALIGFTLLGFTDKTYEGINILAAGAAMCIISLFVSKSK